MLVGISAEYLAGVIVVWVFLTATLYLFVRSRPWRSRRGFVRKSAPILLLIWTSLFAAAAAETGFAFLYDQTDSFGLTKTHERWYVRHVKRNNWTFRDARDFVPARPANVTRIAVLGDSFAFGHGVCNVQDRLGERLEAMLRSRPGQSESWEVINVADPGADTIYLTKILIDLQRRGLEISEVLLVYNLNDIEGLVPELDQEIMGSILCHQPSEWNLPCRYLYLPNFLFYRYQQYSRPEVRDYFGWLRTAYTGEAWKEQQSRLLGILERCRERGIGIKAAIFPFLHNLDNYGFEDAHAKLRGFFESHHVPYVDLLPIMKAHRSESLVVNRFDAHPNARAHQLAAEAIFQALYADSNPSGKLDAAKSTSP